MKEDINIIPFAAKSSAALVPPGSKSLTNRALILAALAGGKTLLTGALFSRDTEIMMDCLAKLGYVVRPNRFENTIEIESALAGVPNSKADLFVGNAGTAARFVTALAATRKGGDYFFDSDEAMYARPISGLIKALKAQGATFEFKGEENHFPFRMKTCGLKGGKFSIDAVASSQMLSAVLMATVAAENESEISLEGTTVSKPFVEMTVRFMEQFGFECRAEGEVYKVSPKPSERGTREIAIEPDATAASYFIALPALIGGACSIKNFAHCKLQGDAKFASLLEQAGFIKTSISGDDLIVEACEQLPVFDDVVEFDFNEISDTFLSLAAISPLLGARIKIKGIEHTRAQECDRLSAVSSQLEKFCAEVKTDADSIEIIPHWISTADFTGDTRAAAKKALAEKLSGIVEIETYKDHRIAMSFAILASANLRGDNSEWIRILDPMCVSKTWKNFFEVLYTVRSDSEGLKVVAVDGGAAVGKSSVSRECSKILGYMHVDTGAHYRTLTYALLHGGANSADLNSIVEILPKLKLGTVLDGASAKMSVNGELLKDADIRNEYINSHVAEFATIAQVRDFLKNYQRSMADFAINNAFCGMIMEGRDIGSVIFPDASVRIFLDADEATRAARRAKEGIADSIAKRDNLDKNRKTAPLRCPEGAELIDTSNMTKDEVVQKTLSLILESK